MEKVLGTLKSGGKTVYENIEVEVSSAEHTSTNSVLRGSFNITPEIGSPPLPSLYELVLEDGSSHQIVVMGLHPRRLHPKTKWDSTTLVDFVAAIEE